MGLYAPSRRHDWALIVAATLPYTDWVSKRSPRPPQGIKKPAPGPGRVPAAVSKAATAAEEAGRRYQERHPGRDARRDGHLAVAYASIPYLIEQRWQLKAAALAALADAPPPGEASPLPTWVKAGHALLVAWARGEPAPPPGLEAVWPSWTDPLLVQQTLSAKPFAITTAAFEVGRALQAGVPRATAVAPLKRALLDTPLPAELDTTEADDELACVCQLFAEHVTRDWAGLTGPPRPARRSKELVLRTFYLGARGRYEQVGLGAPSVADLADLALAWEFETGPLLAVRKLWRDRRRIWVGAGGSIPADFLDD